MHVLSVLYIYSWDCKKNGITGYLFCASIMCITFRETESDVFRHVHMLYVHHVHNMYNLYDLCGRKAALEKKKHTITCKVLSTTTTTKRLVTPLQNLQH